MIGDPSDAIICVRDLVYFFTSRNQRMNITCIDLAPPHPRDLSHSIGGSRAFVSDRSTG
jgi:hypothetical protein